ncbi:hypothetical protein [Consotaella salsifontis]|uniref:Uncharacterized protein n=1 Tax=Consotaella salsifontis TaxID=1365950 RepID=A0A1T4STT8_9HYPH|nr:hypothetical protein [Consotaella salsifontis]SKA31597.1 hypothetical protein SAMN05428963_11434 [Consotaella salsifontis]
MAPAVEDAERNDPPVKVDSKKLMESEAIGEGLVEGRSDWINADAAVTARDGSLRGYFMRIAEARGEW